MKKVLGVLFTTVFVVCLLSAFTSTGCGHHKRHKNNISVIDSTVNPAAGNVTILVHQPTAYDQQVLLSEILSEIKEFNETEQDIQITIEVENNIEVESSVVIEGDKIIVRPGKQKRFPRLYHWFKKHHKHKCKRNRCSEGPKPCNNEGDDDGDDDDDDDD